MTPKEKRVGVIVGFRVKEDGAICPCKAGSTGYEAYAFGPEMQAEWYRETFSSL